MSAASRWWSIPLVVAMLVTVVGPGLLTPRQAAAQLPAPVGAGFELDAGDLRFILRQITIAEAHAAGGALLGPGPNQVNEHRLPFGLRTVDGSFNHLQPGQTQFGAADQLFSRMTTPSFRAAETDDPDGPGPRPFGPTSYANKTGWVVDSQPRLISNLIVDQTNSNPVIDDIFGPECPAPGETCFLGNVAPDVGLSAGFNSWFTFFGQFFDHGLDLVTKGSELVVMPLKADDPLLAGPDHIPGNGDDPTNPPPVSQRFMAVSRATNQPGPDGILGTADDIQEAMNTTTPFVDQNQTYTSHPSHQVFLREYNFSSGRPLPTGRLLDGAIEGNIANWSETKAQAALLGLALDDLDIFNVPLLVTDAYGHFVPGANGFPQVVFPGNVIVEGNPSSLVDVSTALKTGHAFLDDIAHNAGPRSSSGVALSPDGDLDVNPITTPRPAGTYDDELLDAHFITGDGRGNENIALTAVHVVFHAEHNRLAAYIDEKINDPGFGLTPTEVAQWQRLAQQPGSPADPAGPNSGWAYGERLFQAARFATEMQYQHLVFEEFARKIVPQINPFIVDGISFQSDVNPDIPAEFAHAVYRLGHSMLTDNVERINPDGSSNDLPLLEAFLNPAEFNDGGSYGQLTAAEAAGSIIQGTTSQLGNEIDEFVTESLRNELLGLPLDLAAINIARGRSEGLPPLNEVRRQLHQRSGRPELRPYTSWADFSFNLKHRGSLINFIAAYGTHPDILAATTMADKRAAAQAIVDGVTPDGNDFLFSAGDWANLETGLNSVDLWIGGLAERQAPFGSLLGTTFSYVFELTLEDLQNADRFYYLERLDGLNLLVQLEGNSFAELVMRNTSARGLPADIFSRADLVINMATLGESGTILNNPAPGELIRMPNGTIRYLGAAHVNWNGKDPALDVGLNANDRIESSEGDDTLRLNGGNDVAEGGSGNDNHIGGAGDDILTDIFGDDVMKGGPGNDAISSGPGIDLNQGNEGNDFIVAGSDGTETFGGSGNDIIFAGDAENTVFGDHGDDWIEGGSMLDLLQGDQGNQFQNDPSGGHDVITGGLGDDDYDAEGGDDIMIVDSVGTERAEGMLGFDWVTYRGDALPVDADMDIGVFQAPDINELRDRFDRTEALSGFNRNDILRGDSRDAAADANAEGTLVGHELTLTGRNRIAGLNAIVPDSRLPFGAGNIILGGEGSDLIEGRGGDDIIDGDRWLNAQLTDGTNFGNTLFDFQFRVFSGQLNPGALSIVRSIVTPTVPAADCGAATPLNCDTAVFTGARAEYDITVGAGFVTVAHARGTAVDGVDTLFNIERGQFADGLFPLSGANVVNSPATGAPTLSITALVEGTPIGASSAGIVDANGVPGAVSFQWQQNNAPNGTNFVNIAGATGASFTPTQAQVNRRVRVVASFTDNGGFAESVTSAATNIIGDLFNGGGGADNFTGTAGDDIANGNGGADTLSMAGGNDQAFGGAGADDLTGGAGNDALDGGAANDVLAGGAGLDLLIGGAGNDTMNGGADNDTFVFSGTFGNDDINNFDFNPAAGGQDLLDIRLLGVTQANFNQRVTIAAGGGNRTLITIRTTNNPASAVLGTIRLNGGPANYNITDFVFP